MRAAALQLFATCTERDAAALEPSAQQLVGAALEATVAQGAGSTQQSPGDVAVDMLAQGLPCETAAQALLPCLEVRGCDGLF